MSKIFLSYASPDLKSAKRLVSDLRSAGFDVWFDKDSLLPGQHWRIEIERAIKQSDIFIALLSTNSVNRRGYVHSEIAKALDVLDEFPVDQIFLIPARLNHCSIDHPKLSELQWIDMYPNWNLAVKRIIDAIKI